MYGGYDGAGGYAPLATPDSLSAIQINWVHGNHLGVPLVTTDAVGALTTTPNDYLAAGFPGQSRVLPDLYYNRYRDYDPITGRYIQTDPIGLEGGSNVFLYAEGNPVNIVDPEGLRGLSKLVPLAIKGGKQLGKIAKKIGDKGKKFWNDLDFDGPDLERNKRICQIRYKKKPWFRLDYAPYPGTGRKPRLHGHFPWNPAKHVPLDPRRLWD